MTTPGPSSQREASEPGAPRPRGLGAALALGAAVLLLVGGLLLIGWRVMQGQPLAEATRDGPPPVSGSAAGLALVQASDCMRCHLPARKAVGPGYQAIAERHADNPQAVALLAQKIRSGSVGDWGRVIMPRHPQVSEADARLMAQWVLDHRPPPSRAR